jgi:hypothetical protein
LLSVQAKFRNWVKVRGNNTLNPGFVEGNGFYGRFEDSFEKILSQIILY